jgi:uncharacterized protein DUF5309
MFLGRLRKGEQLEAMEFKVPIEQMGARRTDPPPEGVDVGEFEGDKQKLLWQRAQRHWRTPKVTVEAEKVIRNPDLTKGKYNKQVTKKIKEQKRDIQMIYLSDQDSAEDDGDRGSRVMALGRLINDTVGTPIPLPGWEGDASNVDMTFHDQLTAIPAVYRTPTAQIYRGTLANFTEETFKAMLLNRTARAGAAAGEFTLFAGSFLKSHISDTFGQYKKERTDYTVVVRTQTQSIDRKKFLAATIDVYEGEFGIFDIELTFFMPSTYRGYGIDLSEMELRPLMYCDHTELENKGGGRRGLIDSIMSYRYPDPRGAFKIAPSDEATGQDDGAGI